MSLNLSPDIVYAALGVVITEINSVLSSRFASVMYVNNESPEDEPFTKVSNKTLGPHLNAREGLRDLHSLIAWITKYQQKIKSIYCPVKVPTHLHCGLFDMLPGLFDRYVNGDGGGSGSESDAEPTGTGGAANLLKEHVMKVWESVIRDIAANDSGKDSYGSDNTTEEGGLIKDMEGTFHTQAPTTVWAVLNLHLDLAQEAQSAVLQVMVVSKIASAMDALASEMCRFFDSNSHGDTFGNLLFNEKGRCISKERELEWICAIVNDCGSHVDEILDIMHNFKHIYEVAAHVSAVFQPVMARLLYLGRLCLMRLVNIILSDLSEHYNGIFTPDWCNESSIRTAVKTIMLTASDYLADFKVCLVQFWYERCRTLVLDAVCDEYLRSVLRRLSHAAGTNRGRSGSVLGGMIAAATAASPKPGDLSLANVLDGLGKPVGVCASLDGAAMKALEADLQTFESEIVEVLNSPGCGTTSSVSNMTILGDFVVQNSPESGKNSSMDRSSDEQQAVLSAATAHLSLCLFFVTGLKEDPEDTVKTVNELLKWHTEHIEVAMKKEANKVARLAKHKIYSAKGDANFCVGSNEIIAFREKERVDNVAIAKVYLRAVLSFKGITASSLDSLVTTVSQPSGSSINIAKVNMDPAVDEQRQNSSAKLQRLAALLRIDNSTALSLEEKAIHIAVMKRDARAAAVPDNKLVSDSANMTSKEGATLAQDAQAAPEGAFLRREGPQSSSLRLNSMSKNNKSDAVEVAESLRSSVTTPDDSVLDSIASQEDDNARSIQNDFADSLKQERLRERGNTGNCRAEES